MFELMKKVVRINTAKLILFTSLFYLASAFVIHYLEPENFRTPFIGFWWVMTTVTTVGFGDYSPETVPGMLFGIFLYVFGIGLIGVIIGKIVDFYSYFRRMKMEGKLTYKGENHYLIIGWSKKVEKTITEILSDEHQKTDVVLIDHLKEAPFTHERFHYICGNPTNLEVLRQANIDGANSVSVFATEGEDEVLADGKTLLITSAIESYAVQQNKTIYTIAEIVHEDHIPMFQHANVDEFVLSNESFPYLMVKTMLHHGSSQLFMQLLNHSTSENLWEIKPAPSWKTYGDAFNELKEQGANLIAEGSDFSIVRRLAEPISENARLYIICNRETYKNLQLQ